MSTDHGHQLAIPNTQSFETYLEYLTHFFDSAPSWGQNSRPDWVVSHPAVQPCVCAWLIHQIKHACFNVTPPPSGHARLTPAGLFVAVTTGTKTGRWVSWRQTTIPPTRRLTAPPAPDGWSPRRSWAWSQTNQVRLRHRCCSCCCCCCSNKKSLLINF